ncbi:MAG: DUF924 family protein [Polyangiaceae bacterium]
MSEPHEILDYWFGALDEPISLEAFRKRTKFWFFKNEETDAHIAKRFGGDVEQAAQGTLDAWASSPRGRLALVILLDQFPRNIYRGSPRAFASDARARHWVVDAIATGMDARLAPRERFVFYLPLMHTEDLETQKRCAAMYARLRDDAPPELLPEFESAHKFALRHLEIIERFGRFPHRNAVVGRTSTDSEIAFLQEPNSSF